MTTVQSPTCTTSPWRAPSTTARDLVKALFNDPPPDRGCSLSAVNSINWGPVMAQIVTTSACRGRVGHGGPVSFSVPTGNFGNVFAGTVARRMGRAIPQLVIGSNATTSFRFLGSVRSRCATSSPPSARACGHPGVENAERPCSSSYGRERLGIADSWTSCADRGLRHDRHRAPGPVAEVFDGARFQFDDEQTCEIHRLGVRGTTTS